jgi:hypothetical protein
MIAFNICYSNKRRILVGKPVVSPGVQLLRTMIARSDLHPHPIQAETTAKRNACALRACRVFMLRIQLRTLRAAFGSVLRTSLCFGSQRLPVGPALRAVEDLKQKKFIG